eukprot:427692-Rhodomonas_salina.1
MASGWRLALCIVNGLHGDTICVVIDSFVCVVSNANNAMPGGATGFSLGRLVVFSNLESCWATLIL